MNRPSFGEPILVVEDDWMVASLITETIVDAGYQVVGPTAHLDQALELASKEEIVAALLDIELAGGEQSYSVAEVLMGREVPFAFLSARPRLEIDPAFRDLPHIGKPFEPASLLSALAALVGEQVENRGAEPPEEQD
jgi:DNA-binding response OmpR family regulator